VTEESTTDAQNVLIHVRFAPNAAVVEISERPAGVSGQDWFYLLSDKAASVYQPLAGGRGVFRLTRAAVDAIKAEAAPSAA
jgi:hypothetical protein